MHRANGHTRPRLTRCHTQAIYFSFERAEK